MAAEGVPHRAGLGLAPKLLVAFTVQAAAAAIGLITVPIYLHLLGPDAYGLAGFYVTLQGWMVLLDLGLTPTLTRQLSRFRAGAVPASEAAGLLKAGEVVFGAVAIIVAVLFALGSAWIANRWLGRSALPPDEISLSVKLVGALMAARWMAVLYHAVLTGLERQNSLNAILLAATVGRAGVTIAALRLAAPSPIIFFSAQLALTVAEAVAYRLVFTPTFAGISPTLRDAWGLLASERRFAGVLAVAVAIWVAVNQADKLALSHFLSLRQYGYFSLTVAICGGILLIAPPIVQMTLPRLTALLAEGRRDSFVQLYRLSGSLMIVLALAVAGTIAANPHLVFLAWTGDGQSDQLALVLTLYALGTGLSLYQNVPYMLQYAHGTMRLHLYANLAFGLFWIPSAVLAAKFYGAVGAGATWLIGNAVVMTIWTPIVHHRLLSAEERRRVTDKLLLRTLLLARLVGATHFLPTGGLGRAATFAVLALIASAAALLGVIVFDDLRIYVLDTLSKARAAVVRAR